MALYAALLALSGLLGAVLSVPDFLGSSAQPLPVAVQLMVPLLPVCVASYLGGQGSAIYTGSVRSAEALRAAFVVAFLVVGVGATVLVLVAFDSLPEGLGVVRNLLGYFGLGLLGTVFLGATWSWSASCIPALLTAPLARRPSGEFTPLGWHVEGPGARWTWLVAGALLVGGAVTYVAAAKRSTSTASLEQ